MGNKMKQFYGKCKISFFFQFLMRGQGSFSGYSNDRYIDEETLLKNHSLQYFPAEGWIGLVKSCHVDFSALVYVFI